MIISEKEMLMSILAILGLILIVLAILHYIPLMLGLIIGIILVLVGGYGYVSNGRGGRGGFL